MSLLAPRDAAALDAVARALEAPASILAIWDAKDLHETVGHEGVRIQVGPAGSPNVAVVVRRYEQTGRTFPALLAAFLTARNGLNVRTAEARGVHVETTDPDVTNGLLPVENLEDEETSDMERTGLLIGKAFHQERILLADDTGEVLYDGDEVLSLAPSLADFFLALVEHGMSVEALVSTKM